MDYVYELLLYLIFVQLDTRLLGVYLPEPEFVVQAEFRNVEGLDIVHFPVQPALKGTELRETLDRVGLQVKLRPLRPEYVNQLDLIIDDVRDVEVNLRLEVPRERNLVGEDVGVVPSRFQRCGGDLPVVVVDIPREMSEDDVRVYPVDPPFDVIDQFAADAKSAVGKVVDPEPLRPDELRGLLGLLGPLVRVA